MYFSVLSSIAGAATLVSQYYLPFPSWTFRGVSSTDASLCDFVASERSFALRSVLNNIGGEGVGPLGAANGLVVASTSKANPNCELLFQS